MGEPVEPSRRLFRVPAEPRARTSDVLLALAERALEPGLSLSSLTNRLGNRTFGMLLVLVAIFCVLPVVATVFGLLVAVLGFQMALGMRSAWLPRFILDRPLPGDKVRAALLTFAPRVRAVERYIRPRWKFTEAPIVDQLNGLIIALLGIVIALPLPFANLGPALVVIIMGVGLMERDGLLQLSSLLLALFAFGVLYHVVFA